MPQQRTSSLRPFEAASTKGERRAGAVGGGVAAGVPPFAAGRLPCGIIFMRSGVFQVSIHFKA